MAIGQLTMQQLHIIQCTFRLHNCTNCDQLHIKICPAGHGCWWPQSRPIGVIRLRPCAFCEITWCAVIETLLHQGARFEFNALAYSVKPLAIEVGKMQGEKKCFCASWSAVHRSNWNVLLF